jgi:prepilin-type N-terminal cleavage/methylation domain-containing protein
VPAKRQTPAKLMVMKRGFSLPELLLILALAGILSGMALPRLAQILDGIEAHSAASRLASAHYRARIMAVSHSQVVILSVTQDSVTIRSRGSATPLWAEAGPAANGSVLEGPSRQFTSSPEGFTLGLSNATLRLTRGSATRTVVVSRLGRVRITR